MLKTVGWTIGALLSGFFLYAMVEGASELSHTGEGQIIGWFFCFLFLAALFKCLIELEKRYDAWKDRRTHRSGS